MPQRRPRAARRAGYSSATAKSQGWRLARAVRVRARIAEIQATLARDGQALETIIGKLEVVYRQAIEDRAAYAAARAVELQARIAGVERPSATAAGKAAPGRDDRPALSEAELEDLMARARENLRRAAGAPPGEPVVFSEWST